MIKFFNYPAAERKLGKSADDINCPDCAHHKGSCPGNCSGGIFLEVPDEEPLELKRSTDYEVVDKKYDQGKPMVGLMKRDFARALLAVAEVTSYGVKKYNQPGSWRKVENAQDRYEDALGRHDLGCNLRFRDKESGLLELAHRAWNALAVLELVLEQIEKEDNGSTED